MKPLHLRLLACGAAATVLAAGMALGIAMSPNGPLSHPSHSADRPDRGAPSAPGRGAPGVPTAAQLLAKTRDCDPVSRGRYAMREGGRKKVAVCQTDSVYYWTSDMAIDCDGVPTDECNPDTDSSFSEGTNFETSTGDYFTADLTRYFVIPLPSYRFDYEEAGIEPGCVAAVIYQNQVVYAVFADLGPADIIGEASYATAEALGVETDPSVGGTAGPVTFIVFPDAVPDPVEENSVITRVGMAAARSFLGTSEPAPAEPARTTARPAKRTAVEAAPGATGTVAEAEEAEVPAP
ncbi:hypothetical protein GCM10023322_42380 [Rugosimonospora acidiphila]|uniref:Chitosanase of glycosyl hydrolase group 75 n=1 Tax=Rugosimonospora acidiphila TaxID=556531 RepID=A0ABP9S1S5_9ACTN